MPSKTKSLSLPEDLLKDAEERAKNLRFSSFSDYVQNLIRQDLIAQEVPIAEQPARYGTDLPEDKIQEMANRIADEAAKEIIARRERQ